MELTDETFEGAVKGQSLLVVDFWAPWCGPCRQIAPVLKQMAQDLDGKAAFAKMNVDENPLVPGQYEVMSIPTLVIFKGGEPVDRIVGAMPRQSLEPKIMRHLD